MLPWRMVLVALFYCCIKTGVTRCRNKALFPAASRVKRGATTAVNTTFYSSFEDVHLLFEILMSGVHFEDSGAFSVKDAELASLRKTRNLDVICEDIIPKKLTDILKLISDLSNHICHLDQDDFERTLLTLVYTTQQMVSSTTEHQRDVWAESFVSLYKAIKKDLTQTN
ncbi:protein FAM180A-like [Amphiprion ocellaris]|uniref:Globin family profile domain-containing protein n=1 Tax=Amphiprion ocellaris TaxID=80972 RepID=A0AAQ5YUA9_AMPOC|nr:protein FAM180A-like [Amphiprion ocellaris]